MSYTPTPIGKDDSKQLTTLLMLNFNDIAAEIGGGGGGFPTWFGGGRFVSATGGSGDAPPRRAAAPALVVVLPIGFTWLQTGALFAIAEDDGEKYLEVPPNFKGYLSLQVLVDEDGASTWEAAPHGSRPPLGSGTLCYIETDTDGVTLLDTGEARADVIPALPLLLRRLQVLEAPVTGGGAGGSGSGGVSQADFDALQQQHDQLREDFETFRAGIASDSVVAVGFESPTLLVNAGKLIAHAVYQNASSAKSFIAGVDMPGGTGYAQDWNGEVAPLVRIGGNAEYNEEDGVIR